MCRGYIPPIYISNAYTKKSRNRATLSLYYVLKYVGETALSGLPRFSAASLLSLADRKKGG
jgi:hypothetical protein